MMIAGEVERAQDQYAAEHLVGVAAATVRDVARMRAGAVAKGKRLLTFTVETEVRFDSPDGRPYRMVVGGHPAPADNQGEDS